MRILDRLGKLSFRARRQPITTIVLHGTAGASASSSLAWLAKIGLSYHAIVADENDPEGDGTVLKCVPDSKVAFHAGKSLGPSGEGVNGYSLGLAFSNFETGSDPISRAQWDAAVTRCAQWCLAYPSIRYVTTHAIVSPGRKSDPRGPVEGWPNSGRFPLIEFARQVSERLPYTIHPWGAL